MLLTSLRATGQAERDMEMSAMFNGPRRADSGQADGKIWEVPGVPSPALHRLLRSVSMADDPTPQELWREANRLLRAEGARKRSVQKAAEAKRKSPTSKKKKKAVADSPSRKKSNRREPQSNWELNQSMFKGGLPSLGKKRRG